MPLHIHRLVQDALNDHLAVKHVVENTVAAVKEAADRWADVIVDRAGERMLGNQREAR